MAYTLATAAEAAKVTKPTVFRWIKSGRITAAKAEDGTYRIEPAELHRYLDSVAKEPLPAATAEQADTLAKAPAETQEAVAMRYEVEKLKALLDAMNVRVEELRQDRDGWREQAQRLALPSPETGRNGGWRWFRRAG